MVELADVGAVSLEANGHETHLIPRQLPDVTDVVSGVVYARGRPAALFPAEPRYLVHVAGGADVDPFDVSASAPADPSDVRIAGEDGTAGVVAGATSPIDVSRGRPTPRTTLLYVDVQPAGFRCALVRGRDRADERRARDRARRSCVDEAGSIVVHRVHREPLTARGIEGGEIRFDFSRSVPYVRR